MKLFDLLKKYLKKISKVGKKFHLEDLSLIDNLCNNYFYIDLDNLNFIYTLFLKENKLNRFFIKEDYRILINDYISNINNEGKFSELSKKLSLYLKCFMFENILTNYKNNIKYYTPFMIDFRGRKYDLSEISPTFFSELRYCLHLGEYNFNFDIKKHFLKEKINYILLKHKKIIKDRFNENDDDKIVSYM
jgi:hypothetical protein